MTINIESIDVFRAGPGVDVDKTCRTCPMLVQAFINSAIDRTGLAKVSCGDSHVLYIGGLIPGHIPVSDELCRVKSPNAPQSLNFVPEEVKIRNASE